MGWQSYVLVYESKKEREAILNAIREHNDPERGQKIVKGEQAAKWRKEAVGTEKVEVSEGSEAGEELIMVQDAIVNVRTEGWSSRGKAAIMCGNGGGRSYTFAFFQRRLISVISFDNGIEVVEQKDVDL